MFCFDIVVLETLGHDNHHGEVRDEEHSEHMLVDAGLGQQMNIHTRHAGRRPSEQLMGVALELEFHFI